MKKVYIKGIIILVIVLMGRNTYSQQISIPIIDQMPNIPTPYFMRNWSEVAKMYDSLIYNVHATGNYLPIVTLGTSGINYPGLQPIFMDSYVGSLSHGTQSEAINVLPSLVGATLVGTNKSNQYGVDWVAASKDFFNKQNGQNVYLNNASATSGSDWWYDIMPNVFFYQLYSLYPNEPDFSIQFSTIASVWQNAISNMGGSSAPWAIPNMNYHAWYLSTQTPNTTSVIEPEASGSLAWLMYNAYTKLGNKNYLYAAEQCMDFLNGLLSDPSYEIQLPYGTLIAARMNAELGTTYDVEKMVNWIFNAGPLRDWGTEVASWDGYDLSGLVGDVDPGNNYLFLMNGFQQAAALVPMVKYDKRFACAIGKWILNVSNASQLYYTPFIPSGHCDSYAWDTQYDPNGVIGHESIAQTYNGISMYAKGDAIAGDWAYTDLGLYSSSPVGYLGAILNLTNITGILALDLNKTNFYGNNVFPSFLIYNPYNTAQTIILPIGSANDDIYDAITEKVIYYGATGNISIPVGSDSARLLVYLPHGTVLTPKNGKLYADTTIVDYHYQYNYSGIFRMEALAAQNQIALSNSTDTIYCTTNNAISAVTYQWSANGVNLPKDTTSKIPWITPAVAGTYTIICTATSGGSVATDSVLINVVTVIPVKPVILSIAENKKYYFSKDTVKVTCSAKDVNGSALSYFWNVNSTSIPSLDSSVVNWVSADSAGVFTVNCKVTNSYGLFSDTSINVLVKPINLPDVSPLVYYPFDGNVLDYSGNGYNAILDGAVSTTDALGRKDSAYEFSAPSNVIYTPNQTALNFQNQILISFWIRLDEVPEESYIISHGSWQDRYKVSVLPGNILRWTVKTNIATVDLDNSTPLALNTYYHFAVAYTGYSMEIYENGNLDTFLPLTGLIQQTSQDITIGQELLNQTSYTLMGAVDEVRIFASELPTSQINLLPTIWNISTGLSVLKNDSISVFPNPSTGTVKIMIPFDENPLSIEAYDMTGRNIAIQYKSDYSNLISLKLVNQYHGMLVLKLQLRNSQKLCKILFL